MKLLCALENLHTHELLTLYTCYWPTPGISPGLAAPVNYCQAGWHRSLKGDEASQNECLKYNSQAVSCEHCFTGGRAQVSGRYRTLAFGPPPPRKVRTLLANPVKARAASVDPIIHSCPFPWVRGERSYSVCVYMKNERKP